MAFSGTLNPISPKMCRGFLLAEPFSLLRLLAVICGGWLSRVESSKQQALETVNPRAWSPRPQISEQLTSASFFALPPVYGLIEVLVVIPQNPQGSDSTIDLGKGRDWTGCAVLKFRGLKSLGGPR